MKEDAVNYSGLLRYDAIDFVKLDDIKDDMIILENGKRFVAAIHCHGYDFYSAQMDEQASTISGYSGFINVINKPITYRQYCKAVDMEDTLERYESAYQRLIKEQSDTERELADINLALKDESLSLTNRRLYERERDVVQHRLDTLVFRIFHVEDQIRYIERVSGTNTEPDINETYVFDWTYNELDFSVELTQEEIEERARQELHAMARAYIHSLSSCGVKAKRCTTEELIEMYRRYSSPISADRYKLRDIVSSSYYEDIVSSSSPNDLLAGYLGAKFADLVMNEMGKSKQADSEQGGVVHG